MRDMVGVANMRAVRRNGEIVAGLGAIPFGMWVGGRQIACGGVTAVGVAPDARGEGVGHYMLCESLRDIRSQGWPLAVLFPATLTFYRSAGYERAGMRVQHELPLSLIEPRPGDRDRQLVPFGPEQYPLVRSLYQRRAEQSNGNLARPEWLWTLRHEPKNRQIYRFLVQHGETPEGYIVYTQAERNEPLIVTDMVVLSAAAGRRILSLMAGYASMIDSVWWHGGGRDPLVYGLSENLTGGSKSRVGIRNSWDWMLRITDLVGALEQRGYAPGIHAAISFHYEDAVFADHNATFTLTVANGQGRVERGGQAAVNLNPRSLAALYTSFMHPFELQATGQISGDRTALALLGSIFSGPAPWMPDIF
jgi:predicted acetyltransferase